MCAGEVLACLLYVEEITEKGKEQPFSVELGKVEFGPELSNTFSTLLSFKEHAAVASDKDPRQ